MPRPQRIIPPLTTEQRALVERNIGLACHLARKLGPRYLLDDTTAAAYIGLCRAAYDWDPAKGKFGTYAAWWIRSSVTRMMDLERRHTAAPLNDDYPLEARPTARIDPDAIEAALSAMTDRQAQAVRLCFGLGGNSGMTHKAVGRLLGVKHQQVQQLVSAGIKRARNAG